jgi:beta-glucosidase
MRKEDLIQLISNMTIEEKIAQLYQVVGSFFEEDAVITGNIGYTDYSNNYINNIGSILGSIGAEKLINIQREYLIKNRNNIPLLFMADIIHGYRTIFPIPLAQGCTFYPDLVEEIASVAAKESTVAGLHVTFSPMVDLVRDARWGRVMESTGEDPYLNGVMGAAMVTGYQGKRLSDIGKLACCVKHFAAYGAPIAGREYNEVDMSERTFREQYLRAYVDLINAGSALVMTSFNTYDRIPASGNKKLMQGILREELNFEGVLISDWGAIGQLKEHGVAENEQEAAYMAIKAGVDIDMMSNCYPNYLKKLLDDGKITLDEINRSVLRILELKNKLGLFENPFKDADIEEEKRFVLCNNNRLLARKAAAESFVLLKNNGVLPLIDKQQKIAFIGPYIDEKKFIVPGQFLHNRKIP